MQNARNRARKHGAETLNTLTQSLCIPLRDIVNGYRSELRRLHPFEKVVADLTARARQRKDGLTLLDVLVSFLFSVCLAALYGCTVVCGMSSCILSHSLGLVPFLLESVSILTQTSFLSMILRPLG